MAHVLGRRAPGRATGAEVAAKLQADTELKQVPVIFLTAIVSK